MLATESIQSGFSAEISAVESSIVYLPEGVHEISATVDGKPQKRKVTVDERILAGFSEDLKARQSRNVRPFGGFDHKEGPASFIPLEFRYERGTGLILDVEWTAAGRAAIDGKDYSYFSPTFSLAKGKDIPVGLLKRGEVGSLVNEPAFEEIERIAASHNETMDIHHLIELGLVEAGQDPATALEAAKASLATLRETASTVESVQASANAATEEVNAAKVELETVKAANVELTTELETLKAANKQAVEAAADKAIEEAVQAGRIPAQDEETKAFWRESILAKPDSAKILAALPGKDALKGETILAGRKTPDDDKPKGMDAVQAAFKSELEELTK
jgi:phage I-like protein